MIALKACLAHARSRSPPPRAAFIFHRPLAIVVRSAKVKKKLLNCRGRGGGEASSHHFCFIGPVPFSEARCRRRSNVFCFLAHPRRHTVIFCRASCNSIAIHPLTRTTLPNLHRFFNSLVPFGFIPLEIIIDSGLYYKRRNMNGHGGSSTVTVLYKVANAGKEDAGLFNVFEIPRGSGLTLATVKR